MQEWRLHMDAPLSSGSENMTVTNNALICQHHYKEKEHLNECVDMFHGFTVCISTLSGAGQGHLGTNCSVIIHKK